MPRPCVAHPPVDAEDRPDRGVDVDVGGAVERIEEDHVLAGAVLRGNRDHLLVFFRPHHADPAGELEGLLDRFIGEDVELLLLLALHVSVLRRAQDVHQPRPANGRRDQLGGEGDVVEQAGELARGIGEVPLLVQDESLDGGDRCPHEAWRLQADVGGRPGHVESEPPRPPANFHVAAVGHDGDRALLIGSPDRSMLRAEALQRLRRGVTVPVVAPHRQDRHRGRQLPEPRRPARRPAAVMPHLEQVHMPHPPAQHRLRRLAGVAHEDGAEAAVTHQQHHRIVVEVESPAAPGRCRDAAR